MFAIFNPQKKFIGYVPDTTSLGSVSPMWHKEIPSDKTDLMLYQWVGDYDTGQMESLETGKYPIEEFEEERKLVAKIELQYPLYAQLFILAKQLYHHLELKETHMQPEFKEMFESINTLLVHYNKKQEFFKQSENHNYTTKEERVEQLHEVFKTS